MNNNINFEEWFKKISPKLGVREISYKKIIKFLDSQPTPIIIVETGCLRKEDNFLDGQSTLIFDKYTLSRGNGSKVYTVDISPKSTEICKKVVSDNVDIVTEDSVRHLNNLVKIFIEKSMMPVLGENIAFNPLAWGSSSESRSFSIISSPRAPFADPR